MKMTAFPNSISGADYPPFHVMAKPIGPVCNLACKYCFYLEKEKLFPAGENFRMSDDVLEAYIQKYIRSQGTEEITFAWQGGEPTLMGLEFFRKVVAIQRRYASGRTVRNALQTNGTQLNDEWCAFLAREHFLVGLSIDGPEHIHNRYRLDKGSSGSFADVLQALECLKKWKVDFNTLTCVTRESPDEAVEIYTFLKEQDVTFMQFIPIVERAGNEVDQKLAGPPESSSADDTVAVMPWAVASDGFGRFLCAIFDEWIKADVGRIFVNLFEVALRAWCGMEPGLCTFSPTCGEAVALEHDGGIYSCDHYVYPAFYLGNILEQSLEEMIYSEQQREFGKEKRDGLPAYCRACDYLFVCNGECPKHRFINAPDGEPGLNYLCEGYKRFFSHIDPVMKEMAALVRAGRPVSDIMDKERVTTGAHEKSARRNELCPCGSGKKFKKCCGR